MVISKKDGKKKLEDPRTAPPLEVSSFDHRVDVNFVPNSFVPTIFLEFVFNLFVSCHTFYIFGIFGHERRCFFKNVRFITDNC